MPFRWTLPILSALAAASLLMLPASATTSQVGGDIDGQAVGDWLGYNVSLSNDGSRVAVGAPQVDGTESKAGYVRVYDLVGGSWSQVGADINGEAAGDQSGYWVSLSSDGSRVAIGAPQNDGNGSGAGHVRVYDLVDGSWSQVGGDIDGEAAGDLSGRAVSLSSDGDRLAIGASGSDGNGSDAGHVRVYDLVDGSWSQVGADIDGEAAGDVSGVSVSLSSDGSRVAVGAPQNDGNGSGAGHVRVYDLVDGSWSQVGADIDGEASDAEVDQSGHSVAISGVGDRIAIGALGNDGAAFDAGHTRVFELASTPPTTTTTVPPTTTTTTVVVAPPSTSVPFVHSFVDVPVDGWRGEAVSWMQASGVTRGCSASEFCPDAQMTREQQLTFLYRYAGSPDPGLSHPFTDVSGGRYYSDAVSWAWNAGVTTGVSSTSFGTGLAVTRGQAVTFLWRQAGSPAPVGRNPFMDVAGGRYYSDAVIWAFEQGVTTGMSPVMFGPDFPVTRVQFAAFLSRYDKLGLN